MASSFFSVPAPPRDPSKREIAAVERVFFGNQRLLWLGVVVALVPLIVLLILQYRWLTDLERNSVIAHRTSLDNYLEVITKETHYFFASTAERTLNQPPTVFSEDGLDMAARYFASKEVEGVARLFIVTFDPRLKLFYFDPATATMFQPEDTRETDAIWIAAAPWVRLQMTGVEMDTTAITADSRDPEHRIILNPITENRSLLGVAGLIVDQKYFTDRVLPDAIEQSLPKFGGNGSLWVCVLDGQDRPVYPADLTSPFEPDRPARSFDFVFTDWTLNLQGPQAVPERRARASYAINVTLSAALGVILLGGIAFTVRTAMREVKLSAMKNEFVSNVSHELRTPLASIRVFGELMRSGRVDDPAKVVSYGSHIETESRRLSELINNILDFSRIESGRKIYSFEPADLDDLITSTLAIYSVRLRERGCELEYQAPDELLPDLQIDNNAMVRAISNLLDNAIKYSPEGGPIAVIITRRDDEIVLTVADEGIGIPPDELEHVFERFHRVGTGLVHDVKGSGLGLSLVQHIVDAHGGRVTLKSELGKGSAFSIHLPIGWTPGKRKRGHHGDSPDR